MTHKLDRKLKGVSAKLHGYILDNPDRDPTNDVKHHVYSMEKRIIYLLTKRTYDEIIKQIDQNRKNDRHRIEDAAFKIGDYIVFTFSKEGNAYEVVDFELAENPMDLLDRNGRNAFLSQVVFNKKLNRVISEHFGHFDVDPNEIRKLNMIPTPNVVLKCFVEWSITYDLKMLPRIMEIEKLEPDDNDFAFKAEWNRNSTTKYEMDTDDDDVVVEEKEIDKISAIRDKKGFITGLTSVYIPDMPSKTVIFPFHNLREHFIGHETIHLDIVFNEIHKCYIILDHRPRISTHYHTLLRRIPNDIQIVFYVDIRANEHIHGFFRHQHFLLIADPYNFMDMAIFQHPEYFKSLFKVPVKDRLGKVHDSRSIGDLDLVTRFEIAGPGDDEDQLAIIKNLRSVESEFEKATGVVINAKEGRVFGYTSTDKFSDKKNRQGILFFLPRGHRFQNGDHIVFKSKRDMHPDAMKITHKIVEAKHDSKYNDPNSRLCTFSDGWFKFTALYIETHECYEAFPFGFVPSKKPPPPLNPKRDKTARLKEPDIREVRIRARENRQLPGQTVFCQGEFVKDLYAYYSYC